jgi:hypothetical protein
VRSWRCPVKEIIVKKILVQGSINLFNKVDVEKLRDYIKGYEKQSQNN